MWKPNGIRQRIFLALIGLTLLLAGGAMAWMSWIARTAENVGGQARVRDSLLVQMPELATFTAGALAVIVLVALLSVFSALPQKPSKRTFIYRSETGNGISSMETEVLARAAQQAALHSSGISNAEIRIGGRSQYPVLYARYTLRVEARPLDGMNVIRETLIPELEQALGAQFIEKHISIDFLPKKADASNKTTLTV
ncbi:hypothetical protein [Glutamicibacter sp. NPDC087344]|uniref:hypothetical protein n=1 Tax=Glutamicibacter sp. NPDC087344 TaxID=3363994 RepID=UPI003800EF79